MLEDEKEKFKKQSLVSKSINFFMRIFFTYLNPSKDYLMTLAETFMDISGTFQSQYLKSALKLLNFIFNFSETLIVDPVKILHNWPRQKSKKILASKIITKHQRNCSFKSVDFVFVDWIWLNWVKTQKTMNPRVKRLIDMEKMKQEHDLGSGLYVFWVNASVTKF